MVTKEIQEHNPLIKVCCKCLRNIGPKEPYYQFSPHWKDPKAKTSYVYTCDDCAEKRSFVKK